MPTNAERSIFISGYMAALAAVSNGKDVEVIKRRLIFIIEEWGLEVNDVSTDIIWQQELVDTFNRAKARRMQ